MNDFCTLGCKNCGFTKDAKNEIKDIKKRAVLEFIKKVITNGAYGLPDDEMYVDIKIMDKIFKQLYGGEMKC